MDQFIREILMEMPGAFIRWIFYRKKKTFNKILEEDEAYNVIVSFIFIGVLILVLILSLGDNS